MEYPSFLYTVKEIVLTHVIKIGGDCFKIHDKMEDCIFFTFR